jgi:hypothetical protein
MHKDLIGIARSSGTDTREEGHEKKKKRRRRRRKGSKRRRRRVKTRRVLRLELRKEALWGGFALKKHSKKIG